MGPKGTICGCFQEPASQSATSMWSLKVAPNSEFSRSTSVRRDCETRVMGIACDIRPHREKKERAGRGPPLQKPTRSKRGKVPACKSKSGKTCYFAAFALMPLKASVKRDL